MPFTGSQFRDKYEIDPRRGIGIYILLQKIFISLDYFPVN